MSSNRVLGKGLSALIQEVDLKGMPGLTQDSESLSKINIDHIGFNPDQPRKLFNESALSELATSIKDVGLLQPVLLRKVQPGDNIVAHKEGRLPVDGLKYSVIAGERRVRAARIAGLEVLPAIICSYEGMETLKIALLENIQREDLGPVEEAEAYRHLMNTSGATQEKLADMLGKNRSSIANTIRLLALETEILELLQQGKLTRGHAKVLLGMPAGRERIHLAKLCHRRGFSVRECEGRIRKVIRTRQTNKGKKINKKGSHNPAVKALQERAERVYGSPVTIEREESSGKGVIAVRFYSDSDLVRLLKIMGVDTNL